MKVLITALIEFAIWFVYMFGISEWDGKKTTKTRRRPKNVYNPHKDKFISRLVLIMLIVIVVVILGADYS